MAELGGARRNYRVRMLEEEVEGEVGGMPLRGRIDRVDDIDGIGSVVIDYKISGNVDKSRNRAQKMENSYWQIPVYAFMATFKDVTPTAFVYYVLPPGDEATLRAYSLCPGHCVRRFPWGPARHTHASGTRPGSSSSMPWRMPSRSIAPLSRGSATTHSSRTLRSVPTVTTRGYVREAAHRSRHGPARRCRFTRRRLDEHHRGADGEDDHSSNDIGATPNGPIDVAALTFTPGQAKCGARAPEVTKRHPSSRDACPARGS